MVVAAGRSGAERQSCEEIIVVQVSRSKLPGEAEADHAYCKKPADGENNSIGQKWCQPGGCRDLPEAGLFAMGPISHCPYIRTLHGPHQSCPLQGVRRRQSRQC